MSKLVHGTWPWALYEMQNGKHVRRPGMGLKSLFIRNNEFFMQDHTIGGLETGPWILGELDEICTEWKVVSQWNS